MEDETNANTQSENEQAQETQNQTQVQSEEQNTKEKTFTQDEVTKMINEKVIAAQKSQPSKEELEAFKQWQDSQKTEEQKKDETINNAEKAQRAAEERALLAETKVICLSKGIVPTTVDDVVVLAKNMVNDTTTMEQAIDKVLKKYPAFKGQQDEQNGFIKVGAAQGNSTKKTTQNALAKIFGNTK